MWGSPWGAWSPGMARGWAHGTQACEQTYAGESWRTQPGGAVGEGSPDPPAALQGQVQWAPDKALRSGGLSRHPTPSLCVSGK